MSAALNPAPKPLDHLALCGRDDAMALVLRGESLTHQELNQGVGKLAQWLMDRGLSHGDRVASWAAKGKLTCLMPLAAARAGLIHVPINPLLKHTQAAHILADSGAAMLLGNKGRIASLDEGDAPANCDVIDEAGIWEAVADASVMAASDHNTDELCAILYTSGSTGRPKGVMLSHANLWLGAVSVASYLSLASDDKTLAVLPLSFDYGQNQLLSAWYAGGCVVPLDYLTPRDVVKSCAKHTITTLAAVPPLWIQLTEQQWQEDAHCSLRRLTNSGGALTTELVKDMQRTWPAAQIFPMYGLTEAFRSTFLNPELVDDHPTSMGTAIPFAEILVVGDDGNVADPGQEGELVHCGPLVAQGYWQDPERTAVRFKPAPSASEYGGVAVWSGDRVTRRDNGLLYFVGRRDAMIKSAGNRISPQEVEDAALATGLVAEAIALGIPDERLGHAVHLIVRVDKDAQDAPDMLPKLLKKELPNFMQPREIHWRDAMPTNPNGKIDRTALMAELTS